ncbi:MAG: pilin [Patescibacteria group bacterium]
MQQTVSTFLGQIQVILDSVVPFIVGLAVFIVIWGIFNYITHAADEEKRAQAKQYIIWGVVGVFCMLSVWGFVNILYNSFTLDLQIDPDQIPKVPQIQNGNDDGGEPF